LNSGHITIAEPRHRLNRMSLEDMTERRIGYVKKDEQGSEISGGYIATSPAALGLSPPSVPSATGPLKVSYSVR